MSNVADIRRKIFITTSDGEKRQIRFTMNALADLELKYGSIDEAMDKMQKGSIIAIRYVLWSGLRSIDKTLTEEAVGDMIDVSDFERLVTELGKALNGDMPKEEPEVVADPN